MGIEDQWDEDWSKFATNLPDELDRFAKDHIAKRREEVAPEPAPAPASEVSPEAKALAAEIKNGLLEHPRSELDKLFPIIKVERPDPSTVPTPPKPRYPRATVQTPQGPTQGPLTRDYPEVGLERRRWRQNTTIDKLLFKSILNPARLDPMREIMRWSQESVYSDLTCPHCYGSGKVYGDRKTILECTCVDYTMAPNNPKDHLLNSGSLSARAIYKFLAL